MKGNVNTDGVTNNRKMHLIKWMVAMEITDGPKLQVRNIILELKKYEPLINENITLEEPSSEAFGEMSNSNYDEVASVKLVLTNF